MSDHTGIEWADATWNPVTGCTKVSPGCKNCLSPDTPILYADMSWRPIGEVQVGDMLAGFDEWPDGRYRRTRPAVVEQVWFQKKPTLRLITQATEVVTTAEHRWLRKTPSAWIPTRRLRQGRTLRQIGMAIPGQVTDDYRAGYIAGMTLGDGTFRYEPGQRSDKLGFPQAYWRVALADEEPLGRLVAYLAAFGIEAHIRPFQSSSRMMKPMEKVEVRSLGRLAVIHPLVTSRPNSLDWARGWLAGMFDAEGSHAKNLRISQKDVEVVRSVQACGARLGLRFEIEQFSGQVATARLAGDLSDRFRFFTECQPALTRKTHALWGRILETKEDPIVAVETGNTSDVVDIQTSTRTFLAAGLASHNCYAERLAVRLKAMGNPRYRNGFAVTLHPDLLTLSLRWRHPRRIFVNSMSDLFHEAVPDDFIRRVFEVMAQTHWHIFQILTKRAERLAALAPRLPWPENVWQGVSVENVRYTWRITYLRKVPAAVRFLSLEPLLGPIPYLPLDGVHWVIVGGESGSQRRPVDPAWVRDIRNQCLVAGVPFFFKQWGGRTPKSGGRVLDGRTWDEMPRSVDVWPATEAAMG